MTTTMKRRSRKLTNEELRLTDEQRDVVAANLGLVWHVVRSLRPRDDDVANDWFQAGVFGLMRSVKTWEPSNGRLSTYSYKSILRTILRSWSDDRLIRIPNYIVSNETIADRDIERFRAAAEVVKHVASLDAIAALNRETDTGVDFLLAPEDDPMRRDIEAEAATERRAKMDAAIEALHITKRVIIRRCLRGDKSEDIRAAVGLGRHSYNQTKAQACKILRERMAEHDREAAK